MLAGVILPQNMGFAFLTALVFFISSLLFDGIADIIDKLNKKE